MKKHSFVFACAIACMIIPVLAWANMAIPIENPIDNKIIFDPDPGISLVEESVSFSFENENYFQDAKVDVRYVLGNEDSEDRRVEMVFVSPQISGEAGIGAYANGQEIDVGQTRPFAEMPENWRASSRLSLLEPISGKILEKSPSSFETGPYSEEGPVIWGTRFLVNLPAGEETVLEVSYVSKGGIYRYQEVINQIYSQIYYMTPASFYSGEPRVTLELSLPEGMNAALHSNIPLEKADGNVFRAELVGLPEEEWVFTFADKNGLVLGTNFRKMNNGIVLGVFAAVAALALWLWKKRRQKVLAVLAGIAAAFSLALLKPSYGSLFLLYMASPLIAIALLVFALVWAAKKALANRRKL